MSVKPRGIKLKDDVRMLLIVDHFAPVLLEVGGWDGDPGGLLVSGEFGRGRYGGACLLMGVTGRSRLPPTVKGVGVSHVKSRKINLSI